MFVAVKFIFAKVCGCKVHFYLSLFYQIHFCQSLWLQSLLLLKFVFTGVRNSLRKFVFANQKVRVSSHRVVPVAQHEHRLRRIAAPKESSD